MYTEFDLETLIWLQESRSIWLDVLAYTLHIMGLSVYYLLVLTLFYWSVNRRLGLWLLFAMIVSGVGTTIIKEGTANPRPYISYVEQIIPLLTQSSYSFPSGHVAQSVVVWGALAFYIRSRWLMVGVGILALLQAWSRMYLGVHYPTDVIGGILLGVFLLLILHPLFEWLRRIYQRTSLGLHLAVVGITGLTILLATWGDTYSAIYTGLTWGAGAGLAIETHYVRFSTAGTIRQRFLRYIIGIFCVGGAFAVLSFLAPSAQALVWQLSTYVIVGLVATAGYPALAVRYGLMTQQPDAVRQSPD